MIKNFIANFLNQVLYLFTWFFLFRLLFFIYNFSFFSSQKLVDIILSFFVGFYFDLPVITYIFGLPIVLFTFSSINKNLQLISKIFYSISFFIYCIFTFIDFEYFKITKKRTGYELFHLLNDKSNPILKYITEYGYLILLIILIVWFFIKFFPKYKNVVFDIKKWIVSFIFLISVLALMARASFSLKPLRSTDAARFVPYELVSLVVSTPMQIFSTVGGSVLQEKKYFNDIDKLFPVVHQNNINADKQLKKNIVLIIVESLSRDYCGFLTKEKSYTPFLDSLSKKSWIYTNAYATGTTSIDGIPAIMAGIPTCNDEPFITGKYGTNKVNNIGYYLKKINYDISFYHGANENTMGFKNFLGTDFQYFSIDDYPSKVSDFDGSWGIFDEPYLQYYCKELSNKKQPFFSTIFTISNHHPYTIPNEYKNKFIKGTLPIHTTVQYSDYALQMFFDKAKNQRWFNNTIFIITGDHTSYSDKEYFYNAMGMFEIPIIIYSKATEKNPKIISKTVSQIDILPTCLQIANYNKKYFSIGRSILDTLNNGYAMLYRQGYNQLIQYPYVYQLNQRNKAKYFSIYKDNKLINKYDSIGKTKINVFDSTLKLIIQQVNNRMIKNNFYE